jgi:flagellar basal body P-ring formation protein FlgA
VTLVRSVERGEVLKTADMLIERRPRGEIGRDMIVIADQALGLAARNGLQPGRPLRLADLMKPELVQRNETVTLVYEVPGITLTVRGKAAEGGAEGDVISVLNEQSKRTVQAVVVGPGRAVISTGSPRLAANLPPSR